MAVLVPEDWWFEGLNDSKKLGPEKCAELSQKLIQDPSLAYIEQFVTSWDLDRMRPNPALYAGYRRLFRGLQCPIKLDGSMDIPGVESIPRADQTIPAVMAASILAKARRDALMTDLHQSFPVYGWDSNKGYGTKQHQTGLSKNGRCVHHRTSYLPDQFLLVGGLVGLTDVLDDPAVEGALVDEPRRAPRGQDVAQAVQIVLVLVHARRARDMHDVELPRTHEYPRSATG